MADNINDLYGDLDLEDLDASQLEELVEPPELDVAPSSTPALSHTSQPAPAQPQAQSFSQPSEQPAQQHQFGYNSFDQQQQSDGAGDRIKPSDMPDEGKMFIGGLNWETTEDSLTTYMGQFGEIDACTIMRDPSGRSRGFAFLTYKSPTSVTKVMSQPHVLDGKQAGRLFTPLTGLTSPQIDPKRAIPRAEHERTAKVFVGGLAPSVTGESLKSFLCQFGQVMDATVMFDKETGRSKGFAFATFQDEDSVGRAMAASGIELEGKAIEIKKAQPRGTAQGSRSTYQQNRFGGNQPNAFGGGMGGGFNGGGGFDPNSMAMMYQNMMKPAGGMGNMMGGFDPSAMAMMYQNMMKSMGGGNAPAINPNMAMRSPNDSVSSGAAPGMNNMMGMGMGGMGMGGMGMNMGGMGMGMGNMMGGGMNRGGMASRPPNAPRGPAAMRGPQQGGVTPQGPGAQRYSTQGNARARPY